MDQTKAAAGELIMRFIGPRNGHPAPPHPFHSTQLWAVGMVCATTMVTA
jgi:hypothetical protein